MKEIESDAPPSRLEILFQHARKLPKKEREPYLQRECPDAPGLADEVRSLLRQDDEGTKEYLRSPVSNVIRERDTDQIAGPITTFTGSTPKSIDRFRILGTLGEGGMGRVYLARQDEPVTLDVALKVVRLGAGVSHVKERFEKEREVLTMMKHPNICSILDGGQTADGLPYFVMEYVENARSLTSYAHKQNLTTRQRVELFLPICDAVSHGHHKGILHRDLKPSNILIGKDGTPKLIDFGVARTLERAPLTERLTDPGQLLGTLRYMSPEQMLLNDDALDERSDVYSLGVLLYELLSGETPYEVDDKPIVEAARIIQEDPPRRFATFRPDLRGDLETILGKAMEKDRERRYRTVRDLAVDLERYLHTQPILARPPSIPYQLKLFARRHPGFTAATVTAFASLCLTTVLSLFLYWKADRARAGAQAVTDFLTGNLEAIDPRREDKAPSIRGLLGRMESKLGFSFDDRPDLHGVILSTIGRTYHALGDTRVGTARLEQATRILEQSLGPDHPETLEARFTLHLVRGERTEEADRNLVKLLSRLESRLGPVNEKTIKARYALGLRARDQGRFEEAEKLLEQAIEGFRAVQGDLGDDTLGAEVALAGLYQVMGRFNEAEERFLEAIRKEIELRGDARPNTINNYALVLMAMGRYEDAEKRLLQVIERETLTMGEDHPWVLLGRYNLGDLYIQMNRLDEAEFLLADVYEHQREIRSATHPEVLATFNALGRVALTQGFAEDAEPMLAEVVQGIRLSPGRVLELGLYLTDLGACLRVLGRFDEAQAVLEEAHAKLTEVLAPDEPEVRMCELELSRTQAKHRGLIKKN